MGLRGLRDRLDLPGQRDRLDLWGLQDWWERSGPLVRRGNKESRDCKGPPESTGLPAQRALWAPPDRSDPPVWQENRESRDCKGPLEPTASPA